MSQIQGNEVKAWDVNCANDFLAGFLRTRIADGFACARVEGHLRWETQTRDVRGFMRESR